MWIYFQLNCFVIHHLRHCNFVFSRSYSLVRGWKKWMKQKGYFLRCLSDDTCRYMDFVGKEIVSCVLSFLFPIHAQISIFGLSPDLYLTVHFVRRLQAISILFTFSQQDDSADKFHIVSESTNILYLTYPLLQPNALFLSYAGSCLFNIGQEYRCASYYQSICGHETESIRSAVVVRCSTSLPQKNVGCLGVW